MRPKNEKCHNYHTKFQTCNLHACTFSRIYVRTVTQWRIQRGGGRPGGSPPPLLARDFSCIAEYLLFQLLCCWVCYIPSCLTRQSLKSHQLELDFITVTNQRATPALLHPTLDDDRVMRASGAVLQRMAVLQHRPTARDRNLTPTMESWRCSHYTDVYALTVKGYAVSTVTAVST